MSNKEEEVAPKKKKQKREHWNVYFIHSNGRKRDVFGMDPVVMKERTIVRIECESSTSSASVSVEVSGGKKILSKDVSVTNVLSQKNMYYHDVCFEIDTSTLKESGKYFLVKVGEFATTKPFRVYESKLILKNKFEIDERYYNQMGGKNDKIDCLVTYPEDVVNISSKLLYEQGLKPVKNTILGKDVLTQIGKKVCVDKSTNTYRLRFDINDVSSKHDSKKFVICLYVDGPGHLGMKYAPCFTKGIKVYSRKVKVVQDRRTEVRIPKPGIDDSIGKNAKRDITSGDSAKNVMIWARLARESLEILQWSRFAALMDDARHGNANMGWPLFRCPSCFAYRDNVRGAQQHHQNCSLATMLDLTLFEQYSYRDCVQPAMEILENRDAVCVPVQISMPVQQAQQEEIQLDHFAPTKERSTSMSSMSMLPPDEAAMDGFGSNLNNMDMILRVQSSESNVGDNDTNMTSATVSMMKDSDEDFSMIASINRIRRGNSLGLYDENNNDDENDLVTLDTPPQLTMFGNSGNLGDMFRSRNRTDSRNSWGSLQRMASIEYHENSLGALSNDTLQFSRNLSDSG